MKESEIIERLKDRVIHLENTVKVLRGLIGRLDSRLDHTDEKLKYGPPEMSDSQALWESTGGRSAEQHVTKFI